METHFKTIIPIPDDATYGGVMELREYLNGYGEVRTVQPEESGEMHGFIEFTWSVDVDHPSVLDWAVYATRSSATMDDRFDIIGQYVSLVNFHEEVYGEISRLGFSAKGPERIVDPEPTA